MYEGNCRYFSYLYFIVKFKVQLRFSYRYCHSYIRLVVVTLKLNFLRIVQSVIHVTFVTVTKWKKDRVRVQRQWPTERMREWKSTRVTGWERGWQTEQRVTAGVENKGDRVKDSSGKRSKRDRQTVSDNFSAKVDGERTEGVTEWAVKE